MNVVSVSGRLGHDIDVRYKEGGKLEGTFDVGISEYVGKDQESGEPKYDTVWVECVIKDKRAQTLQDELYKGRHVSVSGRLRTSKWKIDETKWVRYTYILVDDVDFDRRAIKPTPSAPQAGHGQ